MHPRFAVHDPHYGAGHLLVIIPAVLVDLFMHGNQAICHSIYDMAKVWRSHYIKLARRHFA